MKPEAVARRVFMMNYNIVQAIREGWRVSFRPSRDELAVAVMIRCKKPGIHVQAERIVSDYDDQGEPNPYELEKALQECFLEVAHQVKS